MYRKTFSLLLVLCVWGSLGLGATGAPVEKSPPPKDDYYELYKILADTVDQVDRNYVKEVSRRELIEAAIKGVMNRLDPYSMYIGPEELSQFRSTVESEFGGIGIHVSTDDGDLKVLSPIYGTPAYRVGILAGDRIVEIDGKSTEGLLPDEAIERMKGKENTQVTLTIIHPGSTKQEKFTLTREKIHVETVLGDRRKANDTWDYMFDPKARIGYVRLTVFSRDTASELKKVLQELKAMDLRGLILDLRFNPGGLLGASIEVSNLFISKGRIVSTKGRNTPERVWDAHKDGAFEGFPMVVLVNHYSASASEIVSACLQDHKRAVIVGQRSWGKGSVQNIIELENGRSALKLTTASFHRPSGKNIHRFPDSQAKDDWGVTPDQGFEIPLSDHETSALIARRRERDIIKPHQAPSAARPEQTAARPQTPPANPASPSDKKDASPQTAEAAPSREKPAGASKPSADPTWKGKTPAVVDRQLEAALTYLKGELARAK